MADRNDYIDTLPPHNTGATPPAAVTLAATDKALYTASQYPVLGGQYWTKIGKKHRMRLFGQATTGATPGNGTFDIYYGTGADANGTILQASAATAMAANQTNLAWWLELVISCTLTGSVGKLFVQGVAFLNALLTTNIPMMIPISAPATSGAIDLTAANIISAQLKRSGSTAETAQVLDLDVTVLN